MDNWTGEREGGSYVIFVKKSLLCEANRISLLSCFLPFPCLLHMLFEVFWLFPVWMQRERDLCPHGSEGLRGRGPSWEAAWHGGRECSGPGASTEGLLVGRGQTEGGDSCHGWPLPTGSPLLEDVSFFVGSLGFASSVVICGCQHHEQEKQWGVRLCPAAAFFVFSFVCAWPSLL